MGCPVLAFRFPPGVCGWSSSSVDGAPTGSSSRLKNTARQITSAVDGSGDTIAQRRSVLDGGH